MRSIKMAHCEEVLSRKPIPPHLAEKPYLPACKTSLWCFPIP